MWCDMLQCFGFGRVWAYASEANTQNPEFDLSDFKGALVCNTRGEMLDLHVCKSIANPVTNSKFAAICTDLHACKLLVCTHSKLRSKCGNGREPVRRKSVANPLQTNYFATNLHACKFNANTKFASDKLANGL